jgi:predicted lipoprotein with Yx(FWY)xxD motif
MRLRGRKLGFVIVAALALVQVVAISPAVAAGSPAAPAKPTATPGAASAKVTWVAPASNGSPINQYIVTPFVGAVAGTPRVFNNTLVSEVITGLVNGTTYTFKVKAHNALGSSPYSVATAAIKAGAPVAPAQPKVANGNALARVNWVAPVNNGAAINGYVVTPFIGAVAQTARVFNTAALVQNITGLVNGTTYTFRVAARNVRGVGPNSVASGAVAPTLQPTLRAVMNTTIGQPILVNSAGRTVYLFVPDAAGTTSHVNGVLRANWPYVTWGGPVTVGAGLSAASATANIQPDNTRLIAYHGHLLYTFVADHVPGDVTGQGLAQFFVLDASGNKIP